MAVEIIPLDFTKPQDNWLLAYYDYTKAAGFHRVSTFHEFTELKKLESTLEPQWHFLIRKHEIPIGTLAIKNTCQQPEPLFFLHLDIQETELDDEVISCIRHWLMSQKKLHGFDKIICYVSKPYIEQFLLKLGGRMVNWLHFFALSLEEVDANLLDNWDNDKLLEIHGLSMVFYDKIPEELMADHANLHTHLSNDIKRKDYSWSVVKTSEYTRKRQKLLELHGKKMEIGYLFAANRKMVGMSKIVFDPGAPEVVNQTITGVAQEYRCLGLAKLLKAKMIKRVIKIYPEVKSIETDCLLGNDSMLFINKKLGFRRKNIHIEKEIILKRLFLPSN